jgi:hypothetical protein
MGDLMNKPYLKGLALIALGSMLVFAAKSKMKAKKAQTDVRAKIKSALETLQEWL